MISRFQGAEYLRGIIAGPREKSYILPLNFLVGDKMSLHNKLKCWQNKTHLIYPDQLPVFRKSGEFVRRFSAKSSDSSLLYRQDADQFVVTILGPPNAGKSTLFNRLLDKDLNKAYRLNIERNQGGRYRRKKAMSQARIGYNSSNRRSGAMAIVSSIAGTTRDRRECIGRIGPTYFRLVDTAGVDGSIWQNNKTRNSTNKVSDKIINQVAESVEHDMMLQSLEAAKQADLILLMFDARRGVTSDLLEIAKWLRKLSCENSKSLELKRSGCVTLNLSELQSEILNKEITKEQICEIAEVNKLTPPARYVAILANKLEGDRWALDENGSIDDNQSSVYDHLAEATRIGLGEPIPVSAEFGDGLSDLAVIIEALSRRKKAFFDVFNGFESRSDTQKKETLLKVEKSLQLAILGRQNVGKSTLVNALLRESRVVTGAMPGLTRDAIAIEWHWQGRPVRIVDTAGIRKKSQRASLGNIEDSAVKDAMRALKTAEVAVLVVDAEAGLLQRQELAMLDAIVREGRSLVVAANKMDLLDINPDYRPEHYALQVQEQIAARIPILRNTPVVALSSLTGQKVDRLMPVVFDARARWAQEIPTNTLNRWLKEVLNIQPPPLMASQRPIKIKYIMQTKGRPPTFLLFANTDVLPISYLRFLVRNFQDTFQMYGMEVRLSIKKSSTNNPYHSAAPVRGGGSIGGKENRKQRNLKQLRTLGYVDKSRRARRL